VRSEEEYALRKGRKKVVPEPTPPDRQEKEKGCHRQHRFLGRGGGERRGGCRTGLSRGEEKKETRLSTFVLFEEAPEETISEPPL